MNKEKHGMDISKEEKNVYNKKNERQPHDRQLP